MASSQAVARLLPTLLRIAHKPGGALIMAAAGANGLLSMMAIVLAFRSASVLRFAPLVLAIVLWVFIASFAVYREFLRRHLDRIERDVTRASVVIDDGHVSHDDQVDRFGSQGSLYSVMNDEARVLGEAYRESTIRSAKYFPRIEATQRALIHAAGGVVNAPYLKYDLRLVIASFLGTTAAIPIALFGFIVCVFTLLLS